MVDHGHINTIDDTLESRYEVLSLKYPSTFRKYFFFKAVMLVHLHVIHEVSNNRGWM